MEEQKLTPEQEKQMKRRMEKIMSRPRVHVVAKDGIQIREYNNRKIDRKKKIKKFSVQKTEEANNLEQK